jgi:hypothetical protein
MQSMLGVTLNAGSYAQRFLPDSKKKGGIA